MVQGEWLCEAEFNTEAVSETRWHGWVSTQGPLAEVEL
jgi:hypothetical protein